MKYLMRSAGMDSAELQLALADGWEPFSAAHDYGMIYLRKRVDDDDKPPAQHANKAAER